MNVHDLINRMAGAESDFLKSEFLAPVLPGGKVRVRIAGVVCTLDVTGTPEPGWAVLKPVTLHQARVTDTPSLRQIRDYLALFPAVRLLLMSRKGADWLALPAHRGDSRFALDGPVQVHFVSGGEPFQQIIARFDGGHFWFQETDRRRNPAVAAYLRESFSAEVPAEELRKPTLTAEERNAYRLLFRAVEEARRDKVEVRLADALAHAGAVFSSYIERDDALTVSFQVDGQSHRSTVRKNDLTVLTAGICLDGQDREFDLQSLVGVLREGQRLHEIYWMDE